MTAIKREAIPASRSRSLSRIASSRFGTGQAARLATRFLGSGDFRIKANDVAIVEHAEKANAFEEWLK